MRRCSNCTRELPNRAFYALKSTQCKACHCEKQRLRQQGQSRTKNHQRQLTAMEAEWREHAKVTDLLGSWGAPAEKH